MWTFAETNASTSIDLPGDSKFLIEAAKRHGIVLEDNSLLCLPEDATCTLNVDIVCCEDATADAVIHKSSEHQHGSVYAYDDHQFMLVQPYVLEMLGASSYPEHISFFILHE